MFGLLVMGDFDKEHAKDNSRTTKAPKSSKREEPITEEEAMTRLGPWYNAGCMTYVVAGLIGLLSLLPFACKSREDTKPPTLGINYAPTVYVRNAHTIRISEHPKNS